MFSLKNIKTRETASSVPFICPFFCLRSLERDENEVSEKGLGRFS